MTRGGPSLSQRLSGEAGHAVEVLVDVDVGQGRCGVPHGTPVAKVGKFVDSLPGLELIGFQAYEGRAQHINGFDSRRKMYKNATARIRETVEEFTTAGLPTRVRSGGGTGTWRWDLEAGVLTELQAGSYLFMAAHYCSVGRVGILSPGHPPHNDEPPCRRLG